jgi:hypothetical protein
MSFSFNKGAKDMESLSEFISLVPIILDGGFDLLGFSDWEELSFLTLLILFGPFQYHTLGRHRLTAPNAGVMLSSERLLMAVKEQLLAAAIAFKANRVRSASHMPLAPRDLSARRNF